MRINKLLAVLAAFFFALAAGMGGIANASIIYNNGSPTIDDGYPIGGGSSTADDFSIAAGGTIRSVGFYFQNYNGITGWDQQVTYAIRADASGIPGTVLATSSAQNVTPTLSSFAWCCGGGNAWLVEFDLAADFVAAAGDIYWLELSGAGGPTPWWVTASAQGDGNGVTNGGSNNYEFAFYLNDTNIGQVQPVPEPASLVLVVIGLAGLASARRRKVA